MKKPLVIKNMIFDMVNTAGAFFIRPTSDGRTLFAGVLSEKIFENANWKESLDEEIWVCELSISEIHRFRVPESQRGLRIDQKLRSRIDIKSLEQIKEWMIKYYWFSFSFNGKNQGCCNVEAKSEKEALQRIIDLNIHPRHDDIEIFEIEKFELKLNKLYSTQEMISLDYKSYK